MSDTYCVKNLNEKISITEQELVELRQKGLNHLWRGEHQAALKNFNEIPADQRSDSDWIYYCWSFIKAQPGELATEVEHVSRILSGLSAAALATADAYFVEALVCIHNSNYERAHTLLIRVLRMAPAFIEARRELWVLEKQGKIPSLTKKHWLAGWVERFKKTG